MISILKSPTEAQASHNLGVFQLRSNPMSICILIHSLLSAFNFLNYRRVLLFFLGALNSNTQDSILVMPFALGKDVSVEL